MDQTPIFFSMVPNTTLNRVGDQSVNVCSSSGSTMHVTVALTVTAEIETLGIEVDHIPGGCTGLAQPIDVGIGKPFKNRV